MNFLQLLLIAVGLMGTMVLGWIAFSGPSAQKEGARRLQALRYRHSDNSVDKVEAQLKKAVAARKPRTHQIAGSNSRMEALILRLHRTGKNWSVSQYLYASLGLAVAVALVVYIKTGAALLSLVIGIFIGAGLPHMVVNSFVARRLNAFIVKFPEAIELLVRGLRSGLPVIRSKSGYLCPPL